MTAVAYGRPRERRLAAGAEPASYDEGFGRGGEVRAHYASLIAELEDRDLTALAAQVQTEADAAGIRYDGARFDVDPVPRLITASEWPAIAAGVAQRVRAMSAFLADAYSERQVVEAGVLPARVIDEAEHYESLARELPRPPWVAIAGPDLLRDPSGRFASLEDNLRTPSGLGFLTRARNVIGALLGAAYDPAGVDRVYQLLGATLRGAFPSHDPSIIVLSDGRDAAAWHEHHELARQLELPVVSPDQLYVRRGRLRGWIGDRSRPVEVIYRRTDEDRLTRADGAPTALGELLIEPLRSGRVACVNPFGAGLADDKAVHGYSAALIRFYLGEEPVLPVIRSYDLSDASLREQALSRLDELVVKGRGGSGGHEVMVASALSGGELDWLAARIRRNPPSFVAQETVVPSTHPTIVGSGLEPRHVDLRPLAFACDDVVEVVPGGLTRFAPQRGEMVVNTAQGGGGKDTWVLGGARLNRARGPR